MTAYVIITEEFGTVDIDQVFLDEQAADRRVEELIVGEGHIVDSEEAWFKEQCEAIEVNGHWYAKIWDDDIIARAYECEFDPVQAPLLLNMEQGQKLEKLRTELRSFVDYAGNRDRDGLLTAAFEEFEAAMAGKSAMETNVEYRLTTMPYYEGIRCPGLFVMLSEYEEDDKTPIEQRPKHPVKVFIHDDDLRIVMGEPRNESQWPGPDLLIERHDHGWVVIAHPDLGDPITITEFNSDGRSIVTDDCGDVLIEKRTDPR